MVGKEVKEEKIGGKRGVKKEKRMKWKERAHRESLLPQRNYKSKKSNGVNNSNLVQMMWINISRRIN